MGYNRGIASSCLVVAHLVLTSGNNATLGHGSKNESATGPGFNLSETIVVNKVIDTGCGMQGGESWGAISAVGLSYLHQPVALIAPQDSSSFTYVGRLSVYIVV